MERSFKLQVSNVKEGKGRAQDFTLQSRPKADRAKQTQSRDCGLRIVQNKPNSWQSRLGDGGRRAKQSQFREVRLGPEGETCETKPIRRRGTKAKCFLGRWLWFIVHACETKPILPVGQGLGGRNVQNEANFRQGHAYKTNPIARSGAPRRCPTGAGRDAARGTRGVGCCTNKPNSCHYADPESGVPGRANRAKQSQSGPAGTRRGRRRARMCKTNPIPGSAGWDGGHRGMGRGTNVRHEANRGSARGMGILPVSPNHGQDGEPKRNLSRLGTHAHATIPPHGGTTNPSQRRRRRD